MRHNIRVDLANARLSYLTPNARFDEQSVTANGILLSLVEGVGVVEMSFDRMGMDSLDDYAALIFMMSGIVTSHDSLEMVVAKFGELLLFQSPNQFRIRLASKFKYMIIFIPRKQFTAVNSLIENRPVSSRSGAGAVLAGALRGVAINMGHSTEDSWLPDLVPSLLAMTEAVFTSLDAPSNDLMRPLDQVGYIENWIEEHADISTLTVNDAAQALGTSQRSLQRLLAENNKSFRALLKEKRLELAAERLRDPTLANQSIGQIAFSCGYVNASNFAAAFKAHHGMSARAYRQYNTRDAL